MQSQSAIRDEGVLVATVAVFGSTDSAQAGVCGEPTGVSIALKTLNGPAGVLADNTYTIEWGAATCGNEDGYTV